MKTLNLHYQTVNFYYVNIETSSLNSKAVSMRMMSIKFTISQSGVSLQNEVHETSHH
jgi:hypothetical protein